MWHTQPVPRSNVSNPSQPLQLWALIWFESWDSSVLHKLPEVGAGTFRGAWAVLNGTAGLEKPLLPPCETLGSRAAPAIPPIPLSTPKLCPVQA